MAHRVGNGRTSLEEGRQDMREENDRHHSRQRRAAGPEAGFALVLSPLFVPLGRWCMRVKRPKWKAIHE